MLITECFKNIQFKKKKVFKYIIYSRAVKARQTKNKNKLHYLSQESNELL